MEFLRARLTEDEQRIERAYEPPPELNDDERRELLTSRTRVLAEVDAKRQIVAKCDNVADGSAWDLAQAVLRLLALPYADHPEYRPEWKP